MPIGRRNSSSNTSPGATRTISVVVNDFNVFWPGFCPDKAEPELVVDADALLAMAVSPERLQAVAWWDLQIVEAARSFEDGEFAEGNSREACESPHRPALRQSPGVAATKRPDPQLTLPPPCVGMQGGGIGLRSSER